MSVPIGDWPASVWQDFINLFCGKQLGFGIGRQVYVLATDPRKVVKVEMASQSFQNAMEWETWRQLEGTDMRQYLAPCRHISPCGIVLIQDRVEPLTSEAEKGARLPAFLTDHKRNNYGVLKGRVVCCDYGVSLAINHGAFGSKLCKPKWWNDPSDQP